MLGKIKTQFARATKTAVKAVDRHVVRRLPRVLRRHLPANPLLRLAIALISGLLVTGGAVAGATKIVGVIDDLTGPTGPELTDQLPQTGPAYPAPEGSPTPYPQPGVASKKIQIYVSSGAFAQNLPFVTNPIQKSDGTPAKDTPVDFALIRPDGTTTQFTMNTNNDGRVIGVIVGDQLANNGEYQLIGRLSQGLRLEGQTTFRVKDGSTEVTEGPRGSPGHSGQIGTEGTSGSAGPSGVAQCPSGQCVSLQEGKTVAEKGSIRLTGSIRGASLSASTLTTDTLTAGTLSGDGSLLTNVDAEKLDGQDSAYYRDAGNINAGTLSNARLGAEVSLLGQSVGAAEIEAGAIGD
ncbi:MAG: hypothetical protein Q8Q11_04205, partial [bacterium]|nr:hypothetical protein [bacterium]